MEEDKQETTPQGNEWEVVSLTASAFASSSNPETSDSTNEKNDTDLTGEKPALSQMMCKSEFEHLVFLPNEHEDGPSESDNSESYEHEPEGLPLESDNPESYILEPVQKSETAEHDIDEGDQIQEQPIDPSFVDSDELSSIKSFDKGKPIFLQKTEFEEDPQAIERKDRIYQGHDLIPCPSDSTLTEAIVLDQYTDAPNIDKPSGKDSDLPSNFQENVKKGNYDGPLCEDWWKKQAASLYARTKEADVYWSIFIAASIVGLVFIGKKWQSVGFSSVDKTKTWFLSFVCST